MNFPQLVVFDMAGTTVEDRGEVPAAFQASLREQGIDVTPEQIGAIRGASKRQAVLALLPEGPDKAARGKRAYEAFKEHLSRRYADGVRSIPGATETFAWLRDKNVRLALKTGYDPHITA